MPTPNRGGIRRTLLAIGIAFVLLSPTSPRAEFMTVNPGITLSYTFGRGLTYGLEVSLVWMPETIDAWKKEPYGRGIAADLGTNFRDFFKMRVGGEIIGPFVGVEAGPALVIDRGGAHLGLGITPWGGWYVMPYYTYTFLFGDTPSLHEVGTYLKVYLTGEGSGAVGSHHDDWD